MVALRLALPLALLTACDVNSIVGYDDTQSDLGLSCGNDGIARCETGLCAVSSVFAAPAGAVTFAVDDSSLFFLQDPKSLARHPLAGGDDSVLLASADSTVMRIAGDATHVYWTELDGGVRGVAKAGGDRFDASYVFGNPTDITVDSTHLYWLFPEFGQIAMAPKPSGDATFISGQDEPQAITTDTKYVYWVNAGSGVMNGELVRARRGNLTSAEVLLAGLDSPLAIAASDAAVYWASKTTVFRLPTGATVSETVATGFSEVKDILVYGATVYGVGMEGLWKVAASGGAWQQLERRPMSGLALSCEGVYGTGWYESVLVRYGP